MDKILLELFPMLHNVLCHNVLTTIPKLMLTDTTQMASVRSLLCVWRYLTADDFNQWTCPCLIAWMVDNNCGEQGARQEEISQFFWIQPPSQMNYLERGTCQADCTTSSLGMYNVYIGESLFTSEALAVTCSKV
jgi:hypothetical protein